MNNLAQDIWGLEWEVNIWSKIYKIMSKLTKQQIYLKFTFDSLTHMHMHVQWQTRTTHTFYRYFSFHLLFVTIILWSSDA
jgi:hypothetical protein